MSNIQLIQGDCLEKLKELEDNSVDSIVTDPPYGLSFMGKKWDYDVPTTELWEEAIRVLKPGGYLLAFGGTRTYHRMAVAIEDAGFEVRDMIEWVYGSGFPKSLNIGKAVDKFGGKSLSWFIDYILKVARERGISKKELTMLFPSKNGNPTGWLWNKQKTQGITLEQYHRIKEFLQLPFDDIQECEREVIGRGKAGLTAGAIANFAGNKEFDLTKGNSEWEGWGTALKPAHEPICMARKPLAEKTVAENCLKWGTGGINIDGCRVGTEVITQNQYDRTPEHGNQYGNGAIRKQNGIQTQTIGRFPANLIHDGSDEVVGLFPESKSTGGEKKKYGDGKSFGSVKGVYHHFADSGSASRFFYCAKASKSERNAGLEGFEEKSNMRVNAPRNNEEEKHSNKMSNFHPTVKPIKLMQYLVRLVTPKGGTVLDPFMGSGSTGIASKKEGFNFIGIELDQEYYEIAKSRINTTKS